MGNKASAEAYESSRAVSSAGIAEEHHEKLNNVINAFKSGVAKTSQHAGWVAARQALTEDRIVPEGDPFINKSVKLDKISTYKDMSSLLPIDESNLQTLLQKYSACQEFKIVLPKMSSPGNEDNTFVEADIWDARFNFALLCKAADECDPELQKLFSTLLQDLMDDPIFRRDLYGRVCTHLSRTVLKTSTIDSLIQSSGDDENDDKEPEVVVPLPELQKHLENAVKLDSEYRLQNQFNLGEVHCALENYAECIASFEKSCQAVSNKKVSRRPKQSTTRRRRAPPSSSKKVPATIDYELDVMIQAYCQSMSHYMLLDNENAQKKSKKFLQTKSRRVISPALKADLCWMNNIY